MGVYRVRHACCPMVTRPPAMGVRACMQSDRCCVAESGTPTPIGLSTLGILQALGFLSRHPRVSSGLGMILGYSKRHGPFRRGVGDAQDLSGPQGMASRLQLRRSLAALARMVPPDGNGPRAGAGHRRRKPILTHGIFVSGMRGAGYTTKIPGMEGKPEIGGDEILTSGCLLRRPGLRYGIRALIMRGRSRKSFLSNTSTYPDCSKRDFVALPKCSFISR